jgi:hypothetical protein
MGPMADLSYYAAKIAECLRLLESSNDPLYRDVYRAMANEFEEKHAILSRRFAQGAAQAVPPSPLLSRPPRAPEAPAAPRAAVASPKPTTHRRAGSDPRRSPA